MKLLYKFSLPLSCVAIALFTPNPTRAADAPPKHLEFSISKSTGDYTGTVKFDREDVTKTFKVTWKLGDGTTQNGIGVAYPKSGYIAVAYGTEATGVAIYKIEKDGGADARWALAKENEEVGTYKLKRGKVKYDYVYKDGTEGTVTIAPSEVEGVANVTFKGPAGTYGGIGLTDGDYLAVGAASGTKDFGVVIYHTQDDMSVSGKWIVAGATSIGVENLTIVSVDGEKIAAEPSADKPMKKEKPAKPATDDAEDPDLAAKISVDLQKCAAVGEYFIEQIKSDDMDSIVGLMDDLAFDEKTTRDDFRAAMTQSRKVFGKLVSFKPDRKKVDFKAAKGGGMNFTLEGDGTYENGTSHEALTFFKPQGSDKVVLVGYSRSELKPAK